MPLLDLDKITSGATAVFLCSAVLIGALCLDVGLLGTRITGRALETTAERATQRHLG